MPADDLKKTLYDLLGTQPDAAREDIERAYREAVARLQPEIDAGRPDALNRLRLLREAHHILADAERRARYDAWMRPAGSAEAAGNSQAPGHGMEGLGWAVVVVLMAIAIGGMLTVFMLLDHVDDVRTTGAAEIVRQKKAHVPPSTVAPQPARRGDGKGREQ